jgi:thymidine kinase
MFEVTFGNMTSGKTTAVADVIRKHGADQCFVIVPFKCKNRKSFDGTILPENTIQSRNLNLVNVNHFVSDTDNLFDVVTEANLINSIKFIVADEICFFTDEQIIQLKDLSYNNFKVIGFGLKCDYQLNPFPASIKCFVLADKIKTLSSKCQECNKNNCIADSLVQYNVDQNGKADFINAVYQTKCWPCFRI